MQCIFCDLPATVQGPHDLEFCRGCASEFTARCGSCDGTGTQGRHDRRCLGGCCPCDVWDCEHCINGREIDETKMAEWAAYILFNCDEFINTYESE